MLKCSRELSTAQCVEKSEIDFRFHNILLKSCTKSSTMNFDTSAGFSMGVTGMDMGLGKYSAAANACKSFYRRRRARAASRPIRPRVLGNLSLIGALPPLHCHRCGLYTQSSPRRNLFYVQIVTSRPTSPPTSPHYLRSTVLHHNHPNHSSIPTPATLNPNKIPNPNAFPTPTTI